MGLERADEIRGALALVQRGLGHGEDGCTAVPNKCDKIHDSCQMRSEENNL